MPRTPQEQYEQAERELVGAAIAETEQEIFDSAFDKEPDDNDGDRSLEDMDSEEGFDDDDVEGESEDEEAPEEEGEAEEYDEPEAEPEQPQTRGGIPPGRLREEAEARRAAEARERELQSQLDQMRGRLDELARSRQPNQANPDQQNGPPDLFADPEGRLNWERQQVANQFEERRLNSSFGDAHEQHGEKFVQAFTSLQSARNPALVREIVNSNNPGRALMQWHDRQSLMADIGNDPAAYRERVRQELLNDPEVRQSLVGGMRQQAQRSGNTQTRLPPSLNSASGGTSHRSGMGRSRDSAATTRSIEQEIFDSVWDN